MESYFEEEFINPLASVRRSACRDNIVVFRSFPRLELQFTDRKMMSDASDMLAAALEQMDGIIAGNLRHLTSSRWVLAPLCLFNVSALFSALRAPGFHLCFAPPVLPVILRFCCDFHPRVLIKLQFESWCQMWVPRGTP